jgi:hypothetical protein
MLKITIELIPFSDPENPVIIGGGVIWNDGTGTENIGNYHYVLRKDKRVWKKGRLPGFPRTKKNVWHLLYSILDKNVK